MNNLITANQEMMMSSREISTLTDKQHKHVIRDIRVMIEELTIDGPVLGYVENTDARGYTADFQLNKELTETLITGYSTRLRRNVIRRLSELEEKSKAIVPALPDFTNPAVAAIAWAEQYQAKQQAEQLLIEQKPAVEFVERYTQAKGNKTFREVAKILNIKENVFREFLTRKAIMYRLNLSWMAKQNHIDCGRFEVITGEINGVSVIRCLFTPKGISWIAGEIAKDSIQDLL